MTNNFTHKFVIEVGIDLTEILAPENIQGVKVYLGVNNDADLLEAVAVDQYKKLATAINNGGFVITNSEFMANTPVQSQSQNPQEQEQKVKAPVKVDESVKAESEQVGQKQATVSEQKEKIVKPSKPSLEKNILEIIKRFVDESSDRVIEKVDIDEEYVNDIPNAKTIYSRTGLPDEVVIDVDELDVDTAMIITYWADVDSQELQYKVVSEQELEEV